MDPVTLDRYHDEALAKLRDYGPDTPLGYFACVILALVSTLREWSRVIDGNSRHD